MFAPTHTVEACDRLTDTNNVEVEQALEMALGGFNDVRRYTVTRSQADDYTVVPEFCPGSPNQLHTPGVQVNEWNRERVDSGAEAAVAQAAPLGFSPLPPVSPLDPSVMRAAAEFLQAYNWILQSLMVTPTVTATVATPPASPAPSAKFGATSGRMVPMILCGNIEVLIPESRVLPTEGSKAYFNSTQNGKGIGRSACRHWLQNRCTYGEKCGFMHAYVDAEHQKIFDEFVKTSGK